MRIELDTDENGNKKTQEPEVIKPKTENIADEIKEQRKLLKGQGPKAYVRYFLDYYKWPTVAVIAAGCLIGSFIKTQLSYVEPILSVFMLNTLSQGDMQGAVVSDFMEWGSLEVKPESIQIDMSSYRNPGTASSEVDTAAQVKIMAMTSQKGLDVLVADAWNFRHYAENNAFTDLRDVLSEEQLQSYEDRIFYEDSAWVKELDEKRADVKYEEPYVSTEEGMAYEALEGYQLPDPAQMKEPVPVGIMLNGSEKLEQFGLYEDTACMFGFMKEDNEEHRELSEKLLEYLLS